MGLWPHSRTVCRAKDSQGQAGDRTVASSLQMYPPEGLGAIKAVLLFLKCVLRAGPCSVQHPGDAAARQAESLLSGSRMVVRRNRQ